ncbi:HEAT repeat domain-containing protein [Planctomycetota bacterium]
MVKQDSSLRLSQGRAFRVILIMLLTICYMAVRFTFADLDVDIPSGTPLDTMRFKPRPEVLRDKIVVPRQSTVDEGWNTFSFVDDLKYDFFKHPHPVFAASITTLDAAGHTGFDYWGDSKHVIPPLTLQHKYILYGHLLRLLLYCPKQVSLYETAILLQTIGIPARQNCQRISGQVSPVIITALNQAFESGEGETIWDKIPPEHDLDLPPNTSCRKQMLYEIIVGDLAGGHFYFDDRRFARRIKMMLHDSRVVDILIEMAKGNKYLVVQRNACAILSWIDDPRAREVQRDALLGDDITKRNRALLTNIQDQEKEIVPWLIKQFRTTDDIFFRMLLVYALGRIDDERVLEPLLEHCRQAFDIKEVAELREFCWIMLPALARKRTQDPRAMELFQACLKRFPRQDPLYQLALLGAAAGGSKPHLRDLRRFISSKASLLRSFAPGARTPAFEVFTGVDFPDYKHDYQLKIILDPEISEQYRYTALMQRRFTKADTDKLATWASQADFTFAMKGLLLEKIAQLDTGAAVIAATKAIQKYADQKTPVRFSGTHIPIAMRILHTQNKLTPKMLLKVLRNSYITVNFAETSCAEFCGFKYYPKLPPPVFDRAVAYAVEINAEICINFLLDKLGGQYCPHRDVIIRNLKEVRSQKLYGMLVNHLSHPDGWIRYCAADCLEALSGIAIDCNWLSNFEDAYKKGLGSWKKWLQEQKED